MKLIHIFGIGLDGHIGFNEPDDFFVKNTHVVTLDKSTIKVDTRFIDDESQVPKKVVTMGMIAIVRAKCQNVLINYF